MFSTENKFNKQRDLQKQISNQKISEGLRTECLILFNITKFCGELCFKNSQLRLTLCIMQLQTVANTYVGCIF